MTPFEIRLELVKIAKDMLSEEYCFKRNTLEQEWHYEVSSALNANNATPPKPPAFPKYFSEDEIIKKASRLNEFISSGNK
jgi:hypothetical protein